MLKNILAFYYEELSDVLYRSCRYSLNPRPEFPAPDSLCSVFVSINFQLDIQGLLKNFMIICFVVQKSIPDILIYFGLLTFK